MEGPTQKVTLKTGEAYDPLILTPPSKRKLGGESHITAGEDEIEIRIAQRPKAIHLRTLYELQGRKFPAELEIYRAYDIWMVSNGFSIIDHGGWRSVTSVGMRLVYDDAPKVTVIGILPRSEFVTHGQASIEADLGIEGEIREVSTDDVLMTAISPLPFGAKFRCATKVGFAGRIELSVISPRIQAIGSGDNLSEWKFERHSGNPLLGDQTVTQLMLVPTLEEKLCFSAVVYAEVRTWGIISTKIKSAPIRMECMLG